VVQAFDISQACSISISFASNASQDTDETIIKDKIDNLEAISAKFVQMRMNSTISKAMRGHNVEEFQE
jgi:hypothetical protein